MELSLNEWATWRSDPTTKKVLAYLKKTEDEIVELLISGGYKTYSEVEKARGAIEGLREIYETPRGE
jgi:hypothetical protein